MRWLERSPRWNRYILLSYLLKGDYSEPTQFRQHSPGNVLRSRLLDV